VRLLKLFNDKGGVVGGRSRRGQRPSAQRNPPAASGAEQRVSVSVCLSVCGIDQRVSVCLSVSLSGYGVDQRVSVSVCLHVELTQSVTCVCMTRCHSDRQATSSMKAGWHQVAQPTGHEDD
jgi:hypothetical protein